MKYKFVGNGAGVPGLPHEISEEEAKELGLESLLHDAIENGNYKPVEAPLPAKQAAPQVAEQLRGKDLKKKESD